MILAASSDPVTFGDRTPIELTSSPFFHTDAAAIGARNRFYRLEAP